MFQDIGKCFYRGETESGRFYQRVKVLLRRITVVPSLSLSHTKGLSWLIAPHILEFSGKIERSSDK